MKQCSKCNKPINEDTAYKDKRYKGGLRGVCKACMAKANAKYKKANPDQYRGYGYQQRYGITLDDYNLKLEAQGGVCAICHQPNTHKQHGHLVIDHCHTTGKVRDLLCHQCNSALGYLRDDPTIARAAAEYLETHND